LYRKFGNIYNISTRDILPTDPPFKRNFSFYANDSIGNEIESINYTVQFVDTTPPIIRIIEPPNNYTNKPDNDVIIETDEPCYCNFSWLPGLPQFYVSEFSSTDRITHTHSFDLSGDPGWYETNKTYYIRCDNIMGLSTVIDVPLIIDVLPLSATRM